MKNESKKANAKLTSVLAAVFIIVVAIVAVIAVKTKDSGSLGTYSCEIMSGDNSSTVFEITFNEKNNTYKENISVGDKAVELASGTFVMDGNKLTLTSDGGDVQNLVKQGKYLIAKDYLYEGEIPDGDTFDATCTFKNSNNVVYSITFKADGTYVQDDNGDVSEGTYTRDGDWIKRESSSGTSVGIDYLIYSGRITNSYYIKK